MTSQPAEQALRIGLVLILVRVVAGLVHLGYRAGRATGTWLVVGLEHLVGVVLLGHGGVAATALLRLLR